jgi:hypothetical protein
MVLCLNCSTVIGEEFWVIENTGNPDHGSNGPRVWRFCTEGCLTAWVVKEEEGRETTPTTTIDFQGEAASTGLPYRCAGCKGWHDGTGEPEEKDWFCGDCFVERPGQLPITKKQKQIATVELIESPTSPKSFGRAIELMKKGHSMVRMGWIGPMTCVLIHKPSERAWFNIPFICMCTVPGQYTPWQPSQADMLAEDWKVYISPKELELEQRKKKTAELEKMRKNGRVGGLFGISTPTI